jgi:hypothetical protein
MPAKYIPVSAIAACIPSPEAFAIEHRRTPSRIALSVRREIDRVRIRHGKLPIWADPPAKRGRKPLAATG